KSKEVETPRYLSLVVPLRKVGDEAVHKELGDRMERAATTASSSEAEQDSGSGPRCQDTILGDVDAQTRFETTSKQSNNPPFSKVNTFGSGEDNMKILELMAIVHKCLDWHQLLLLVQVPAAEGDVINTLIQEASIRNDLHLDNAEGTDCLPNTIIFEELTKMGYEKPSQKLTFYKAFFSPQWKFMIHTITQSLSAKTTTWNEFSSTMASLIICLATNRKFNLSKYIFDAMVKHLDGGVKFLMYPRFLQVFINQQLGDMSHHKKTFVNPFHTKKIFANMKREGKDFSGRVTPLFDSMLVQASEVVGEDSIPPTDSTQIPIIDQPSTSFQPKKKQKSRKKQKKEAEVANDEAEQEENIPTPSNDPLPSGEDSMQLIDLMAIEIASLKKRVDKLEKRRQLRITGLNRFKKLGTARRVKSYNASLGAQEDASKQRRSIEDIDADAEVFVDVTTSEKDEQSTKLDDSTAGEAVTTASVEDSIAKVVTYATTTTTLQAPRVPQESQPLISKDKGKGIMVEPEVPLKVRSIALDEQIQELLSLRNIQAMTGSMIDCWLEKTPIIMNREELTVKEKGKLFMELMEKRRKHFAALRAQEKRNRPPTKAHKRELKCLLILSTCLWIHIQTAEGIEFDDIQMLFDKKINRQKEDAWKKKKAGKQQQQESSKKQKMEEDKESDEVEEVSEMIKKGQGNRSSLYDNLQLHKNLQGIDREDLEVLWRIVKAKHNDKRHEVRSLKEC
ncbi:hypothetical protein Tco_0077519, partial [Tanacetum coccineum]